MDQREPGRRRGAALGAGLLALLVGALVLGSVASGAGPVRAPAGIPDAGAWTGWSLRVAEAASLVAAVLTTGSLLVATVLLGPDEHLGRGRAVRDSAVRSAACSAAVWLVASVASAVLVVADAQAVPVTRLVSRLLSGDEPWRQLVVAAPGTARGHLLAAVAAAAVVVLASRSADRRAAAAALALTLVGLVPPRLAGHAGAVADQDVVATGIVVHVVAAAVWVGGLVGLLVHLRRAPALRAGALGRFSPLAGGAYLALAVSGAASASVHLAAWSAWSSGYAALVLAKVALLALLGWCGALHRRRLRDPAHAVRAPFARLAVVEVALMAVAGGLAAALSRTPLPVAPVAPEHGTSHPGLPAVVQPVSAWLLVGAVRPNALALLVVGCLLVGYRLAVRRAVAAGVAWPDRRLHDATAAAVLAVVVLCSGLATYAPAMLSVQVLQLLLMLLVVPAVVVRAAPARLWRRPVDPVVGAVAVGGLVVLVYRTPLLEASQRSHWVHLTLLLAATAAGTYHLSALAPHGGGGEQATRQARLAPLLPAACLGVLGAQLLLGDRLVAGRWFLELRWGWVDPAADQRLAGLLALVAAAGLVLAVVVARPGAVAQDSGQIRTSTSPSRSSAGTGP